ncbi:lipid A biosynthesis acyltransferase [Candidatus Sumerlaeota bacterium]|nr:lipid A biosynthesis acyltransferase [Candidatus Sumerlaeota bacterium]
MPRDDEGKTPQAPRYGGRLGHGIFRWVLRSLGVTPAYLLLALVAPYYVFVRTRARRSADYYLRRRFPDRGRVWRFFASLRYFYRFGQVLIDQAAIGVLGKESFHVEFPQAREFYDRAQSRRGMVLVTSHVGSWQAAMVHIGDIGVPVCFQFRREEGSEALNAVDSGKGTREWSLVSPDGFMGGLIEMTQALQAGECVAVMGDRSGGGRTGSATFLGARAEFPIAGYRLAACTGANVEVLLTVRTGKMAYRIEAHNLSEGIDPKALGRDGAIDAMLRRYVRCLEECLARHPFMWFNFFDIWSESETSRDS